MLADDSGIELAALDGAPGVVTARWSEGNHVEKALAAVEGRDRRARYVCELVALSPDGRELRGTGVLDGTIALEPAGSEGFGFDPVFVPLGESAHGRRAGRCVEGGALAPRARGAGATRPRLTAAARPARHQLTSAPSTITFAITYSQTSRIAGPGERLEDGVVLRDVDVHRQPLERRLEDHRSRDRARQNLAHRHVGVRQHVVGGRQEHEEADRRDADRDHPGRGRVAREADVPLQHLLADRPDHERREQGDQRADHHHRRERLAVQEAAVRPAVDDVEGALEHAEERQRRPEQEGAADDPERRGVRLDGAHGAEDRVERRVRERLRQLADEERALVGLVHEAEEREREEEQRHEREQREVGDHRGQVGAAVGEVLTENQPHSAAVCSPPWTRLRRSPT